MSLFDVQLPSQPVIDTSTPRPYQVEAIDAAFAMFAQDTPGALYRMATGMGKTATASSREASQVHYGH